MYQQPVNIPLKMGEKTVEQLEAEIISLPKAALTPIFITSAWEPFQEMYIDYNAQHAALGVKPTKKAELEAYQAQVDELNQTHTLMKYMGDPEKAAPDEPNFYKVPPVLVEGWGMVVVDGVPVHAVSANYKVVQHQQAFKAVIDTLKKMGVDKCQCALKFTQAAAYLYVVLPKQYSFVAPDGVAIDCGFVAVNAHDSTHAVEFSGFGMRQVCANGMVSRKLLGGFKSAHVGAVMSKMTSWMANFSQNIQDLSAQIGLAMSVGVTRDEAQAFFRNQTVDSQGNYNKSFVKRCLELWDSEYAAQGENMYSLMNVATDVYSHESINLPAIYDNLVSVEPLLIRPKEIANRLTGLVLKYREDDHNEELRKIGEKAQKAIDAAKKPTEPPIEIDLSKADPIPAPVVESPAEGSTELFSSEHTAMVQDAIEPDALPDEEVDTAVGMFSTADTYQRIGEEPVKEALTSFDQLPPLVELEKEDNAQKAEEVKEQRKRARKSLTKEALKGKAKKSPN